jgi:hypothetical protein
MGKKTCPLKDETDKPEYQSYVYGNYGFLPLSVLVVENNRA